MRLDLALVERKLANSRTQAADLIANELVFLILPGKEILLKKNSHPIESSDQIIVKAHDLQKFVSRAGLKLESAILHTGIIVKDQSILDVGQSTGGFTDCLVKYGARKVVGIDVGSGQLHAKLLESPNVVAIENLNAKDLDSSLDFNKNLPKDGFDSIVMDVSFISVQKVIPHLVKYLKKNGHYLFLIKPQFECGAKYLNKNGVLESLELHKKVETDIVNFCTQYFNNVSSYFKSALKGKDGNQEYFIYGKNESN